MSAGASRSSWGLSLALGGVALGARLAFMGAGPDAEWPYTLHYKGDALVWLQWSLARRADLVFEAGVPLRPPGTVWLVEALWDGTPAGIASLRFAWALLGAAFVVVFHRALLLPFGARVAALAAGLAALSSAGLILSTSLGNETPYLLLVVLAMLALPRVERASLVRPVAFGALHAAATLVRAEHALVFAVLAAYLAVLSWRSNGARAAARSTLFSGAAFVLVLVPWHLSLWAAVARFNAGEVARDPGGERALAAVEARTDHIAWLPEAREEAQRLPPFTRRSIAAFVAATVQQRGGGVVGLPELRIVREAYGTWPRALARHPFVAAYGPLNFWLANNPRASAGFSRAALDVPPPLAGGPERYPRELVAAMPPSRFSFQYPPHLEIFNDGYRLGLEWIRTAPGPWARLAAARLGVFWSGASLGYTGHGLPAGASGLRRAVDMVVPRGPVAALWRWIVLLASVAGVLATRSGAQGERSGATPFAALVPWLLYAACRVAVGVAFFGYARQGALILPVVDLLLALAIARWIAPRLGRRALWIGLALLAAGLAVETVRRVRGVTVVVDGTTVGEVDPFPAPVHVDREVRFLSGSQK